VTDDAQRPPRRAAAETSGRAGIDAHQHDTNHLPLVEVEAANVAVAGIGGNPRPVVDGVTADRHAAAALGRAYLRWLIEELDAEAARRAAAEVDQ